MKEEEEQGKWGSVCRTGQRSAKDVQPGKGRGLHWQDGKDAWKGDGSEAGQGCFKLRRRDDRTEI